MKRREFIRRSTLASSLLFVPNFVKTCESIVQQQLTNKKLVIIQLAGGNDGLNTVVPFRNDIYLKSRPKISILKSDALKLQGDLGLHPSLTGLMNIYNKGYLSIINDVGYPNPVRSHFRSNDIWQTASDSDKFLNTGWLGRYLDVFARKPYYGIEIDDALSVILKGNNINGIATKNPKILYANMQTPYFKKVLDYQSDEHLSEHNLGYLYKTMIEAESSAKYIFETTRTFKSKLDYPRNQFGRDLKSISEFINSGLDSKVYFASLGGFDTHVRQNERQSRLLKIYADAIEVMVKDLEDNNNLKDTIILTFSEFGRRVKQNASNGTDHGAANQVFVIGNRLKKAGLYNDHSELLDLDDNGDIKYKIDFREIFASIIDNWLGAEHPMLLGRKFKKMDIV